MNPPRRLSAALAVLMAIQSGLGLTFPGAYRDIPWIKATWFGNDLVTLAIAVPLLAVSPRLAHALSLRAPVRAVGGWFVFVAFGLTAVWLGMWAAHVFAGRPTPVEPEAFRLVAALDTTLMVPALAVGGTLLWRRHDLGVAMAGTAGIQATLYLLVLTLNSALAIAAGRVPAPGELPVWGGLLVPTGIAAAALVWHVRRRISTCLKRPPG